MIRRFLGAMQFLTVIPIPANTPPLGQCAVFFPLVGALLGAAAGSLAPLFAIAFLLIVTGCLHEDGLADIADAVRAGRTREKMLLILKDSRIGTYGAVALILSVLVRWQAIAQYRLSPIHISPSYISPIQISPVYALAAALALSRTALVALAVAAPPIGDGLGRAFADGISLPTLLIVIVQAVAFSCLAGWRHGVAMILATATIVLLARIWFLRRLGGVNGDCLGATCQVVETVNLVILTWQPSF